VNILLEKIIKLDEIFESINVFNECFIESMKSRVGNLWDYSVKISCYGNVYLAKVEGKVVGIIIFYANDIISKAAYITTIAVLKEFKGNSIGKRLLSLSEDVAMENGMKFMELEVHKNNISAIRFYENNGYSYLRNASEKTMFLRKELEYAAMDKKGKGI